MSARLFGRAAGLTAGLALVACLFPGTVLVAGQLESALGDRAEDALAAARISAEVTMHGRQATVSAATDAEVERAVTVVSQVPGIAEVVRAGEDVSGGEQPGRSASPTPNITSTPTSDPGSQTETPVPTPTPTTPAPAPFVAPVHFDGGSAALSADGRARVGEWAAIMAQRPELVATLVGHTDNGLTLEARYELGFARAEAVRAELIGRGVAADRLTIDSRADLEPIGDNWTDEGARLNRRVEVIFEVVG